ncbi:hypothetical protein, partial [Abditibacterium utsteinense]
MFLAGNNALSPRPIFCFIFCGIESEIPQKMRATRIVEMANPVAARRIQCLFIRIALDTPLLAAGRKERNGAAVGKRVRATIKECLF